MTSSMHSLSRFCCTVIQCMYIIYYAFWLFIDAGFVHNGVNGFVQGGGRPDQMYQSPFCLVVTRSIYPVSS